MGSGCCGKLEYVSGKRESARYVRGRSASEASGALAWLTASMRMAAGDDAGGGRFLASS